MTNRNYARGAAPDLQARKDLAARGFTVWKAHASKGPFDVYAARSDVLLLVQVKRTKRRIVSLQAVETAFRDDLDGTEKKIGIRNIPVPAGTQEILALWSDKSCEDLAGWRWYRICADKALRQIPDWYEHAAEAQPDVRLICNQEDEGSIPSCGSEKRCQNLAEAIT